MGSKEICCPGSKCCNLYCDLGGRGGGGGDTLIWVIWVRAAEQGMIFWPRGPKQGIQFGLPLS